MIFQFNNEIGFMAKELINLHKPFPVDISIFLNNEKNMGEWSVDKVVKMSALLIDSCKWFETRK